MDKKGLNIAVIGGMGSGKSTYIKNRLQTLPGKRFIYDPNEEYQEPNQYRGRMIIKDFTRIVNERSRNAVNIFEEATAFFRHGATDANLIDLMTRKRHYRVINFFVFHNINAIPVYVFSYLDYIVLFKTNDRGDLIEKKYSENPQIIKAAEIVKTLPKYKYVTLKLR